MHPSQQGSCLRSRPPPPPPPLPPKLPILSVTQQCEVRLERQHNLQFCLLGSEASNPLPPALGKHLDLWMGRAMGQPPAPRCAAVLMLQPFSTEHSKQPEKPQSYPSHLAQVVDCLATTCCPRMAASCLSAT